MTCLYVESPKVSMGAGRDGSIRPNKEIQKSIRIQNQYITVILLFINNNLPEGEIKGKISFINAAKRKRHMKISKEVMYTKNYKTLMKETEDRVWHGGTAE